MNINRFIQKLRHRFRGEIHTDLITRNIYRVDASIYEVLPQIVALPLDREDLVQIVEVAYECEVPITPRGAATGITGGCLGSGLILDLSKYLNGIKEINFEEEYAICEPGVVQDRLNEALAPKGYRLGPDTSTGNRATIGGMMANNAAGARSLLYGKMVDHVEAIELITGEGAILFKEISETEWEKKRQVANFEGIIYRTVWEIRQDYAAEIAARFPAIPRHVSGYNFDELLNDRPLNICKLIVGSEGTLGVASSIKVKIAKQPKSTGLCVVHFHEMVPALQAIPFLLSFHPIALEMIDDKILQAGRASPTIKAKMNWLQENPELLFVAEFSGDTAQEVQEKLHHFASILRHEQIGYAQTVLTIPSEMNQVWELRKAGLGLLLSKRSYNRAIAFIEDLSIPPAQLAFFMQQFITYLKRMGKEAGIYGHVGSGCMHIRPYMDLRSPKECQLMQNMMEEIADLVLQYGGSLSGEHGDGLIRSWLNEKMFGKTLMTAFKKFKRSFDPKNLMNPGKIIEAPPLLENLRLSPDTKIKEFETFLNFENEGGLALAADLCNGNGLCRKKESIMCPSFQATHDEYDTTRARAQVLRELIHEKIEGDLSSQGLYDVLDLCLECKGCKTECPSQVDMAKMKAEALYHYQKRHGIPLRNRLFGYIGSILNLFKYTPRLFNAMATNPLNKLLLEKIGITQERSLPLLALNPFSHWLKKQSQKQRPQQVVLFNDTYTQFNDPTIGQAAYFILQAMGYEVIVPEWKCCGRPLISKGMLPQAKNKANQVIEMLLPYAEREIPIIGLEPSCILTIKTDYASLMGRTAEKIALLCTTFDEFLYAHLLRGNSLPFLAPSNEVLVHGHCHQKALVGMKPTLEVLKAIQGLRVSEIRSGCCGLAGSFGYECEHYPLSMKIGELVLLPAVRQSPEQTLLIANGISCRSQILHGTGRRAMHLSEALLPFLKQDNIKSEK